MGSVSEQITCYFTNSSLLHMYEALVWKTILIPTHSRNDGKYPVLIINTAENLTIVCNSSIELAQL